MRKLEIPSSATKQRRTRCRERTVDIWKVHGSLDWFVDRKMCIRDSIITRLKRDEYISTESIEKICLALNCGVDDILEFVPEKEGRDNA